MPRGHLRAHVKWGNTFSLISFKTFSKLLPVLQQNKKLDKIKKLEIKYDLLEINTNNLKSVDFLGKKYNVSKTTILSIKQGKAWKHILENINEKVEI